MVDLTIKEIGIKLTQAGMLKTSVLCVYGSDTIPVNATPMRKINRCLANVIFTLSTQKIINKVYIGEDDLKGYCPGGQAWFGYKTFIPMLKYFLSTGSEDFRGGAAEFLIANPDLAEKQLRSIGKISPLGRYTVIQKCDELDDQNLEAKAFICFGVSEQIRNLCSLAHFRPENAVNIQNLWGASCASFVTYPAGMAENSPKNSIIIGPSDPTGNYWFPRNYLSIGIAFEIATRMARDLDQSFITKRSEVAYPVNRTSFKS
ncbi:hypothetical protein LCGC14_0876730 [marine sediment metagenome]|uniref:DUF169 domain-containing protein n=1 Tax=marine sediment metagenome TaxID=412755 RepID=A0A0F9SA23_9ZZZZ